MHEESFNEKENFEKSCSYIYGSYTINNNFIPLKAIDCTVYSL